MPKQKIYKYTFLVLLNSFCLALHAQDDVQMPEETAIQIIEQAEEKAPILAGGGVSVDFVGLFMKLTNSKYANMEVAGRLNFKEKFFPLCEVGLGQCDKEGGDNDNTFSTSSPYFRVGMDYNINKKLNGNRFFCGLRYAFSSFQYDVCNPDFNDPVWKVSSPLILNGQDGKMQWLEIVVGVETKLWSIVRLGWNIRYKSRLHQSNIKMGEPWYVPGFGKNGSSGWGGTVNLLFDVGKTAKKQKK